MNHDLLNQAKARVASAQAELDRALVDGTDTTKAREHLAGTQAEVARIEAGTAAEQARIEMENRKEMERRAQDMVETATDELGQEFEAMGFTDPIECDIPAGPALDYLRASELALAEMANEQRHAEATYQLQVRIADLDCQLVSITERRLGGEERQSDAAQYALLSADRAGLVDMLNRMAPPQTTKAALWAADARQAWQAAIGAARVRVLDALTQEAENRLIAVAKARLTAVGGQYASRYQPSVLMQKILAGRVF